ncbi:hypothetical protein WJX75_009075 [Coccomyxa subellipsoidea]|uniref:Uncharacterized protein n=1 Tax=Coccomyxa subellipsoidea TaxID=248742 RepID=A0ABR2Z1Z8_9CHLO
MWNELSDGSERFLVDLDIKANTLILYIDTGTPQVCPASCPAAQMESQGSSDAILLTSDAARILAPGHENKGAPSSPRNPSSPCSLHRKAQLAATRHFDTFWRRRSDGAPLRWSQLDECWRPGVQAAVAATVLELSAAQHAPYTMQILNYMQEKAVRQYGEVVNGHNFKRPPSAATLQRYRALAFSWGERFQAHYEAGTIPLDIRGLLDAYAASTSSAGGSFALSGGPADALSNSQFSAGFVCLKSPFTAALAAGGGPGSCKEAFPSGHAVITGGSCKRPRADDSPGSPGQELVLADSSTFLEATMSTQSGQDTLQEVEDIGGALTAMQAADVACLASDVAQLLRMHAQANAQINMLCSHVQKIQQQLHAQALDTQDSLFLLDDILST